MSSAVYALALALIAIVAVIFITGFKLPESPEWESIPVTERGRITRPGERPGLAFKVAVLTSLVIATALTYAFLALAIGPYLFPQQDRPPAGDL